MTYVRALAEQKFHVYHPLGAVNVVFPFMSGKAATTTLLQFIKNVAEKGCNMLYFNTKMIYVWNPRRMQLHLIDIVGHE
jgi:hypothetical protein